MSVSVSLSPQPILQFFDNNGELLSGGKLFTYAAGTVTKLATYTDDTGDTTNTNPIILNSSGQATVWLPPGTAFKYVLAPATDSDPPTDPLWTVDGIIASFTSANANIVPTNVIGGTIGVTIASANGYIGVNNTTGTAFALNLPPVPAPGEQHTITDIGASGAGNAGTFTITVNGNGKDISGQASYPMTADGQSVSLTFINGAWAVN